MTIETLSLSEPQQPSERRLLQYLIETNRRLTADAEMRLKRDHGPEAPSGQPPRPPSSDSPPASPGDHGAEGSPPPPPTRSGADQGGPVVQRPREYLDERGAEEGDSSPSRPPAEEEPMRHRSRKEEDTTDLLERHRRLNEDSRRLLRDS